MKTNNMIDVSIVIVCMNNLKNLYPCLNSIRKYTSVSYETLVVAYLFSKENLEKVRRDFPWVTFIESNEIRGFSENNNLALKRAKGEYCFVLNDDTYFDNPVIDKLLQTFNSLPKDVAILSPVTLNVDGSIQRNGKPQYNLFSFFLDNVKLIKYYDWFSKFTNKTGVYQTYNISGAAFMIRRDVFKNIGWFDEQYFFCPEDIALSTFLNERGSKCYVDASIRLTHNKGGTWSKIHSATMPSATKGSMIFYCKGSLLKKLIFLAIVYSFHSLYGVLWYIIYVMRITEKSRIMYHAHINTIQSIGTSLTPKQIFIRYYKRLNER